MPHRRDAGHHHIINKYISGLKEIKVRGRLCRVADAPAAEQLIEGGREVGSGRFGRAFAATGHQRLRNKGSVSSIVAKDHKQSQKPKASWCWSAKKLPRM